MEAHAQITILVLGPMQPTMDDSGNVAAEPRTVQLTALTKEIVGKIVEELPEVGRVEIDCPEDNRLAAIIPGVLAKIEDADLVVCDLSAGSQNVMYELGLVHALGVPYILVIGDDRPPFYVRNYQCISRLDPSGGYDPGRTAHSQLRARIQDFLRVASDAHDPSGDPEDFAANPVSEYFDGLPIVDISAPVGLAAGYWANAIRRFVRDRGYFESPVRNVILQDHDGRAQAERPFAIDQFIAVQPLDGLNGAYEADFHRLQAALKDMGYGLVRGTILQATDWDLRQFGAQFLGKLQSDGKVSVIEPAVVLEIPTTLYALQYSPRIRRIDGRPIGRQRGSALVERLRRRRFNHMLDRFGRLIRYYLNGEDARTHSRQVHYVSLAELKALLDRLISPSGTD